MDFFLFLKTKKFFLHLLGVVVAIAIVVWIILLLLNVYTQHGRYLSVPDFAGTTIDQITTKEEYKNYEFVVVDSVFDLTKPKGTILHQDPFPASKVKKNRKIYLTIVSCFPEKTSMPDLKDLTLRQSLSTLESIGLKPGKISYIRTFDEDAVQQQFFQGKVIIAGTKLDKGSVIDLTVGMGSKGQVDVKENLGMTDSL